MVACLLLGIVVEVWMIDENAPLADGASSIYLHTGTSFQNVCHAIKGTIVIGGEIPGSPHYTSSLTWLPWWEREHDMKTIVSVRSVVP